MNQITPSIIIEPSNASEFAQLLDSKQKIQAERGRIDVDPDAVKNGLGQLVLTLVKLLHELLERQALRRMDSGSLSLEETERVGVALMKQADEIERLRVLLGLHPEDLNLDLGPLGKLL
jgi:hypothetical protein